MSHQINLAANLEIKVTGCNFRSITISFLSVLGGLFEQYLTAILLHYFEVFYQNGDLAKMLGVQKVNRKTVNVLTKFKTLFGDIRVPQIQVRVLGFDGIERQMSITRKLLGVSPKFQIPDFMKELMGWIGSVSSFRVGHNIIGALTNFKCSLQSVWNSVGWYARKIKLGLSPEGTNEFDADGTGIPTKEGGKRGSELKKVFQRKKNGQLHLVGISIGKYKETKDWLCALSSPIKEGIKKFGTLILASDADKTIINTTKAVSEKTSGKVFFQMDKWHVFHQLKYYLWQDKVAKENRSKIIAHIFKITMLSKLSIKRRDKRIKRYILLLSSIGYTHAATYLETSMEYFYTHEKQGNTNIYTSKTERSMRTTNQRINIGIWSRQGALNVSKVRLAYYYNGISPLNWKKAA